MIDDCTLIGTVASGSSGHFQTSPLVTALNTTTRASSEMKQLTTMMGVLAPSADDRFFALLLADAASRALALFLCLACCRRRLVEVIPQVLRLPSDSHLIYVNVRILIGCPFDSRVELPLQEQKILISRVFFTSSFSVCIRVSHCSTSSTYFRRRAISHDVGSC